MIRFRVAVAICGTVLVDAPDRDTAAAIAASAIPSLGEAPIFDRALKAWALGPAHDVLSVPDVEISSGAMN